jgi:hypothetical protein
VSTTKQFYVHSLAQSYGTEAVSVSMSEVPVDSTSAPAAPYQNSISLTLTKAEAGDFNIGDHYKVVFTKQAAPAS